MSKKVLAIISTPRKGGNSELLTQRFVDGAKEAGNTVETVFLRDKKINPCLACENCQRTGGACVHQDDMAEVMKKLIEADVIVLSTPVYFYSLAAQLKLMIDRTFAGAANMKNKEFYLIATAADGRAAMETTMRDMEGFASCIPESTVKGRIYGSAYLLGDVCKTPAMEEAYECGRGC